MAKLFIKNKLSRLKELYLVIKNQLKSKDMKITVDEHLSLELLSSKHTKELFQLIDNNRTYLRNWLPLVEQIDSLETATQYVNEWVERNNRESEYSFVILENNLIIGRIGVYKINSANKTGEIGYWIAENAQGKGIVSRTAKVFLGYCFSTLNINRMELKCGTENYKSVVVAKQLNFQKEGIIRAGEWLHNRFIDLNFYSLLKNEFLDN